MKNFSVLALLVLIVFGYSQDDIKIKADVFMDYFYSGNHDSSKSDKDGFAIRRVYLSFNKKYTSKVSAKLRLEMGSADYNKDGSSTKLSPVIKDLSLAWKLNKNHKITFGIQGNSTVSRLEKFYGLRYVEKTPADLYKIESTRETGVSISGNLTKKLKYHALFGNGEGNKSEDNRSDYFSSSIAFQSENILAELNGHINTNIGHDSDTERTMNTVLGFKNKSFKTTASFHYKENFLRNIDALNSKSAIASLFTQFNTSKKSAFYFRFDKVLNGLSKSPSYYAIEANEEFGLFVLGYTTEAIKNITIAPNFTLVDYNGSTDSDVIGKITLRFKF